jgi:hypothetical protein
MPEKGIQQMTYVSSFNPIIKFGLYFINNNSNNKQY